MSELTVGNTYKVKHNRKGTFLGKLSDITNDWYTFRIVEGKTNAIMDYNVCEVGENVVCRESLFTAEPVDE